MLSVPIDGYYAPHVLEYQARELNSLLAQIPVGVALADPRLVISSPRTARPGGCGR